MFSYIWPLALVIISNTVYQICTKSVPEDMHPMASLTVTYAVGAIVSLVLYLILDKDGGHLLTEYGKLNWAPIVLGLVIVGLEVGFIYAYKAGWPVSVASIVQSSVLAILLLLVGRFLYQEPITWNKVVGMAICLVGLFFINR